MYKQLYIYIYLVYLYIFSGDRLNPDCLVENGIIITDNITSAITLLQTRNVLILRGATECGKTYAFNAILNHFKAEGFKIV